MSNKEFDKISKDELLDLIFEKRNKSYGAYDIRKSYYKHLAIALLCTSIIVIVWFLVYFVTFDSFLPKPPKLITSTIHIKEYKLPPVKKPNNAKTSVKPHNKPKRSVPLDNQETNNSFFHIVENKVVIDKIIRTDNIQFPSPPPLEKINKEETFTRPKEDTTRKTFVNNELFDIATTKVTSVPHFMGGVNEWNLFLQKNLKIITPLRNGAMPANYTAIISFYVHSDSTLSHFSIVKDPGYGMGAEALRVVKLSGKWIPGTKNYKAITFAQLQTVVFKVKE